MTRPDVPPALVGLGLTPSVRAAAAALGAPGLVLGRIFREHKGGYGVMIGTAVGVVEWLATVNGKLRRDIKSGACDRPVPGDWVLVAPTADVRAGQATALIHALLPRATFLRRRSPDAGEQYLAANVDTLIVVMALNQDFSLRRLERYLALAKDGGVRPLLLLSKADLAADAADKREAVRALVPELPVVMTSTKSGEGLLAAAACLRRGETHVLLGSSGVGKSTLINSWLADGTQATRDIRDDGKGRHTTTHRQLFLLAGGALVMDSPGMRELGVTDDISGLRASFADIDALAQGCRFGDCRHESEPGCAIRAALQDGVLDQARYDSYQKLAAERSGVQDGRAPRQRKR